MYSEYFHFFHELHIVEKKTIFLGIFGKGNIELLRYVKKCFRNGNLIKEQNY